MPRIRTGAPPPHVQVADYYRRRIAAGKLAPGDKFPTLAEIAEAWGVARVTAHRAVVVLRGEGLVITQGRRGTFVTSSPPGAQLPHNSMEE